MLEKFFNPASVAILGASNEEGKVGHAVMKNMVESGYGGRLHPVNPRADSVQGLKACGSLQEIEGGVDLAVFVIPPAAILKTIEELRGKGTDAAIVISAGFKETGTDGAALERELVRKAKEIGVRILGPNCLGLIDTHSRVNASFAAAVPPRGNVSIFSQSGAILTAMLDWAATNDFGVSKIISLGNEADLTEVEFLEFLGSDPTTEVILGYIEGLRDGRAFMEAAKKVSHSKPIIMIKGGGTAAGSRAASSHTGSLAGFDAAYDAAFRQCHVIRARTVMELFNMALGFAYQPLPEGPNLAIITNAGGPGIMASDACERLNLPMASFEKATVEELAKHLPPVANLYNPVDVIGDARADRYERALDAVLADPGVDGVLVLLTPQEMTEVERTAEVIGRFAANGKKTLLTGFLGAEAVRPGREILRKEHVPCYSYPEHGVTAFEAMARCSRWRKEPESPRPRLRVNRKKVETVLGAARSEGRARLVELEAREVIGAYGFRLPKTILAESTIQAMDAADRIGFPVVMKIVSPDILHKSDVRGVKVGVETFEEVRDTFNELTFNAKRFNPRAQVWGVAVQEMLSGGVEVILGLSRDPSFGPLLMFGLGGIYVEVIKDVAFRVCPVDLEEARSMIREIRSFPLLAGVRGRGSVDLKELEISILRLSELSQDFPDIHEADINPLLLMPEGQGAVAIDARFILREGA